VRRFRPERAREHALLWALFAGASERARSPIRSYPLCCCTVRSTTAAPWLSSREQSRCLLVLVRLRRSLLWRVCVWGVAVRFACAARGVVARI